MSVEINADKIIKNQIHHYNLRSIKLKNIMQSQVSPPLSNMQLELLKLFSRNVSEETLIDIRRMLAKYFMQKAIDGADRIWDERGYTNELMEEWLNEPRKRKND